MLTTHIMAASSSSLPTDAVVGDRRLADSEDDRLGFSDAAKRIARAINNQSSADGLVIGLDGKWGSGKSSLLFLVETELEKSSSLPIPTIINFKPWLIGNRDGLLAYLFTELNKGIARVASGQGDVTKATAIKAKEAGEALKKFAAGIGEVGGFIEIAGDAISFPPVTWAGKGIGLLKNLKKSGEPQLDKLKDRLVGALRNINHRFVITIDDVDRLDPAEMLEVLRLTRSVVDLPNVTYILCYDSEILSQGIERAANVPDGKAYLEKIIQLSIMVPQPEAFQLRHWFSDEISKILTFDDDGRDRLRTVIDYEGGRQLRTPRSVIKVLDSIRFVWPALSDTGIDVADLVWLLLIKDGNPQLYRWIEGYCATLSAISIGVARVEDNEKRREFNKLMACISDDHFDDLMYRHFFCEQLPGVDMSYAVDGDKMKLFESVPQQDRDRAILHRRLASPDHYRLYFALSLPTHAITQSEYDHFWKSSDSGVVELTELLINWHELLVNGGLSKAEILLERVHAMRPALIDQRRSMNLLRAFAEFGDGAFRIRPFDGFHFNSVWDRCERLITPLFERLDPTQRSATIRNMFREGRAIGWLTTILRREMFAHGRYGDRPKSESEWYFSELEYDEIAATMLQRFCNLELDKVLASPQPLSLLYAWRQLGDEDGPRNIISKSISTDSQLVDVLESLVSVRTSSNRGAYSVLGRENVEAFLDFDDASERIKAISNQNDEIGERALRLARAIEDSRDD